jgi:hypothetical protein
VKVDTLKQTLADWTDLDVAAYHLAICLGLMQFELPFAKAKHVFWTNHPIGTLLVEMLDMH